MIQKRAIRLQTEGDSAVMAQLAAEAFGPERFLRSAFRVRAGASPVARLCLSAVCGDNVVGGIGFTAIQIGAHADALLLGPLVVDASFRNRGHGRALVAEGLARARAQGFRTVLLVGDLPYYRRFGFRRVPPGRIVLPGRIDPARLLILEFAPDADTGVAGAVRAGLPHARPARLD